MLPGEFPEDAETFSRLTEERARALSLANTELYRENTKLKVALAELRKVAIEIGSLPDDNTDEERISVEVSRLWLLKEMAEKEEVTVPEEVPDG